MTPHRASNSRVTMCNTIVNQHTAIHPALSSTSVVDITMCTPVPNNDNYISRDNGNTTITHTTTTTTASDPTNMTITTTTTTTTTTNDTTTTTNNNK